MNCPNCGSDLPDDATFCTNCGANIAGEETVPEPEPEQTAEQEPAPPKAEPTPGPARKAEQTGESKPFFKQWYGILLIIIVVLILLCCCCSCIGAAISGSFSMF